MLVQVSVNGINNILAMQHCFLCLHNCKHRVQMCLAHLGP